MSFPTLFYHLACLLLSALVNHVFTQLPGDAIVYRTQVAVCSNRTYNYICDHDYKIIVAQGMKWGVMNDMSVATEMCYYSDADCHVQEKNNEFLRMLTERCNYRTSCLFTVPELYLNDCQQPSDYAFLLFQCAMSPHSAAPTTPTPTATTLSTTPSIPSTEPKTVHPITKSTSTTNRMVTTATTEAVSVTESSSTTTTTTQPTSTIFRDPRNNMVLQRVQVFYCTPGTYSFTCENPDHVAWFEKGVSWGVRTPDVPREQRCLNVSKDDCQYDQTEGEFLTRCDYRNRCVFDVPSINVTSCDFNQSDWLLVLFSCGVTSNPTRESATTTPTTTVHPLATNLTTSQARNTATASSTKDTGTIGLTILVSKSTGRTSTLSPTTIVKETSSNTTGPTMTQSFNTATASRPANTTVPMPKVSTSLLTSNTAGIGPTTKSSLAGQSTSQVEITNGVESTQASFSTTIGNINTASITQSSQIATSEKGTTSFGSLTSLFQSSQKSTDPGTIIADITDKTSTTNPDLTSQTELMATSEKASTTLPEIELTTAGDGFSRTIKPVTSAKLTTEYSTTNFLLTSEGPTSSLTDKQQLTTVTEYSDSTTSDGLDFMTTQGRTNNETFQTKSNISISNDLNSTTTQGPTNTDPFQATGDIATHDGLDFITTQSPTNTETFQKTGDISSSGGVDSTTAQSPTNTDIYQTTLHEILTNEQSTNTRGNIDVTTSNGVNSTITNADRTTEENSTFTPTELIRTSEAASTLTDGQLTTEGYGLSWSTNLVTSTNLTAQYSTIEFELTTEHTVSQVEKQISTTAVIVDSAATGDLISTTTIGQTNTGIVETTLHAVLTSEQSIGTVENSQLTTSDESVSASLSFSTTAGITTVDLTTDDVITNSTDSIATGKTEDILDFTSSVPTATSSVGARAATHENTKYPGTIDIDSSTETETSSEPLSASTSPLDTTSAILTATEVTSDLTKAAWEYSTTDNLASSTTNNINFLTNEFLTSSSEEISNITETTTNDFATTNIDHGVSLVRSSLSMDYTSSSLVPTSDPSTKQYNTNSNTPTNTEHSTTTSTVYSTNSGTDANTSNELRSSTTSNVTPNLTNDFESTLTTDITSSLATVGELSTTGTTIETIDSKTTELENFQMTTTSNTNVFFDTTIIDDHSTSGQMTTTKFDFNKTFLATILFDLTTSEDSPTNNAVTRLPGATTTENISHGAAFTTLSDDQVTNDLTDDISSTTIMMASGNQTTGDLNDPNFSTLTTPSSTKLSTSSYSGGFSITTTKSGPDSTVMASTATTTADNPASIPTSSAATATRSAPANSSSASIPTSSTSTPTSSASTDSSLTSISSTSTWTAINSTTGDTISSITTLAPAVTEASKTLLMSDMPWWVWLVCAIAILLLTIVLIGAIYIIYWRRRVAVYSRVKAEKRISSSGSSNEDRYDAVA